MTDQTSNEKIFRNLPSQEKAQELRNFFSENIEYLEEDVYSPWKGRVYAVVQKEDRAKMREAMNFVGAIVDNEKELPDGRIKLFSRGYYHHIGA